MDLNALVLCADDQIVRVLRRVLGELEVGMQTCADANSAVRRLTRSRYEAVIVDCTDDEIAAKVLSSVRSAPCNKRAVAVAIIDAQKAIRSAFTLGAHFVLYKPISFDRARGSLRAVRALMKCERRRNVRVAVELPVVLMAGNDQQQITTLDISEGGMAVRLPRYRPSTPGVRVQFSLPGVDYGIECRAEVAWKNQGSSTGVRFLELSPEQRQQLKAWLVRHSPEIEPDDPPVSCKLTDISTGACYLDTTTPFPVRTRVLLTFQRGSMRIRVEGIVRVMHPEAGMGVEFSQPAEDQRAQCSKFVHAIRSGKAPLEITVLPEGMEDDLESTMKPGTDDPLLHLFHRSDKMTTEAFRKALKAQRDGAAGKVASAAV